MTTIDLAPDTIDQAYDALLTQFLSTSNYWQAGNAFDTMIDYLIVNPQAAVGLAPKVVNVFNTLSQGHGRCWYDDDGWWMNAAARAMYHAGAIGWDANLFEPILMNTWNRFGGNAPYVWENDQSVYPSLKPLISGGVWNSGWPLDPCGNPVNPTIDNPNNLAGIQNTVTNGLFAVGAQRMVSWGLDPQPMTPALNEFNFLTAWLGTPPNGADSLMHHFSDDVAVVRERVTAFDSSQPAYGYHSAQAWLGDQGLILGTFVVWLQLPRFTGAPRDQALTWAKNILNGVSFALKDTNGYLLNWPPSVGAPGGDKGDYATGFGVFFRYLLYAWNTDQDLKAFMASTGWPQIVAGNLDAPQPYANPLVAATNRLAVLMADQAINHS